MKAQTALKEQMAPEEKGEQAIIPKQEQNISIEQIVAHCDKFKGADTKASLIQISTTLCLYFMNLLLIYFAMQTSYLLGLIAAVPAAGLLTRIFIIQHDCGHGSFFNSNIANNITGSFLGVLTMTPYSFWKRAHNLHHATSGNLDKRSIGGIDTVTVQEFMAFSPLKKLLYKIYRHPAVLLIFGTPFYVIIMQRLPVKQSTPFFEDYKSLPVRSTWKSIIKLNIALLAIFLIAGSIIGYATFAKLYIPVVVMTSWIGGWLFYIQHQFEHTYWEKGEHWDMREAALLGSSYYDLPPVLDWFTGSIGLHHIHHLCSKIPNYKLKNCMKSMPELGKINRITLAESFASLELKLWDENEQKMVAIP
jgi:omega-6 fatty acid desaturase (delta-12 desaturase)